ncbi:MAG TPA: DUF4157 domain-containing protein [Pyrinomonadaceae bacterium]
MSSREQANKDKSSTPKTKTRKAAPKAQLTGSRVRALRAASMAPQLLTKGDVRQLQRTVGNRAVRQMLAQAARPQPVQKKENSTGLPDALKLGVENLSGYSMDDVKVHYDSAKPAHLHAHAYTQGTDIHLAPGQEEHLPHEAWHVVQQKQGRVRPTMQMKGGADINDDKGLEKEADVMGAKALDKGPAVINEGRETQRGGETANGKAQTAQRRVVQRVTIAGIEVENEGQMPTWEQDGVKYHINLTTDTYHVTKETSPKVHYFYEGYGEDIKDKQPSKAERGGKSKKKVKGAVVVTKTVFSKLPAAVQTFIKGNYREILAAD